MKDHLMGREQETAHVQSRFSNLGAASSPEGEGGSGGQAVSPVGPQAASGAQGTLGAKGPQAPRGKSGTLPPATEGRSWSTAAALRLGAAGFGLLAAVLFMLPALSGSFVLPRPEDLTQPTYKTITPAFDGPAAPENLDEVVTEQSTAFDGAAVLVVDSEPEGVTVVVDGNDQGGTPVSLTLDCLPGKPIKVELSRRGYERAKHTTFCRTNTMIKLHARMRKAEKAPGGKK
jgi:hypothetical protein